MRVNQPARSGFTMIELLISALIMGFVTVYLMETFTVNQRAYIVVDQVTESQQSMRAIADLIERDIRHAGLMVPAGGGICGIDQITQPDSLFVSDADTIDPTGQLDPNLGASFAGNNVPSFGTVTLSLDLSLENPDRPAYDTDADGANDSDFQLGAGVIVMDRANPGRGTACGTVTNVSAATNQLTINILTPALGPLAGTPSLVAIPAHAYQLNGLQLLRDGLVLAQGVEDLQIAYFIDSNNDNIVDPGEYLGDGIGPDYQANAVDGSDAREIRLNLVVRTRAQDPTFNQGQFQTTENRVAVAGNDGFRRRVHTSTALLRNVAQRTAVF